MGFDYGHCNYERMAQAVPPQYGQLVFAQACGRLAQKKFGAPFITFDEMRARPSWARRTMALWLRGAGDPSPAAGVLFEPEPPRKESRGRPRVRAVFDARGQYSTSERAWFQRASRACVREMFYSHAGGYDFQWCPPELRFRLEEVQRVDWASGMPSALPSLRTAP